LSLCFNRASLHEGILGSGGIAPRILGLGTRWRRVVSYTPRSIYSQGKSSWCPVHKRLGGPQSRSEGKLITTTPPPRRRIRGVEVQLHAFLTLALDGSEFVSFMPRRFHQGGKSPWYPLDRRVCGPQRRSRRGGEEKKSCHYARRELNPGRPAHSLVSVLTDLTRLLYF
jgi:hypothetical protein